LFAEELRLLDHIDDETASWEAAYDAVREAVVLRYPDGNEVPEFLLHVRRPRGMVAMERRTVRGLRKTDVVLVRGTEDPAGTIERESRQTSHVLRCQVVGWRWPHAVVSS
jgi:hypothetical protein